jgi:CBS domain-containing protein
LTDLLGHMIAAGRVERLPARTAWPLHAALVQLHEEAGRLLRAFAGRVHPSEARVREWMTAEPISVPGDTPIETAVTLMTEYGFHHLPIVEGERPVGMLGLRQAAWRARDVPGLGSGSDEGPGRRRGD